jgi:hypothetical protein
MNGNIPMGIDRNPLDDWKPMIEQLQAQGFQVSIEDPAERNPIVRLVRNEQRLSLSAVEVIRRFRIQGQAVELVPVERVVEAETTLSSYPDNTGPSEISSHMLPLLRETILTRRPVSIEDSRERNPYVIGGLMGAREGKLYFDRGDALFL